MTISERPPHHAWQELKRKSNRKMKMKMKLLILLLVVTVSLKAQTPEEQPSNAPFDLPNAIIYGNATLNVGSSIKRFPNPKATLNKAELDSINSLEKQQSLLLPMSDMPRQIIRNDFKDGFLRAGLGMFLTPVVDAGVGFDVGEYKLYANANVDLSAGHLDNAEYSKLKFAVSSDYIAPDKFFIFGGSKTRTKIQVLENKYNTFAALDPEARTLTGANIDIDVDGNYAGYLFNTGLNTRLYSLETLDGFGKNNGLGGWLEIYNPAGIVPWTVLLTSDFDYINTVATRFLQGIGKIEYGSDQFNTKLSLGFQNAVNSAAEVRSSPFLEIRANAKAGNNVTISAGLESGLEKTNYVDAVFANPYLMHQSLIDFRYNQAKIKSTVYFHPTTDLNISGGFNFAVVERYAVWKDSDEFTFSLDYLGASLGELFLEGFYNFTEKDKIIGNFTYTFVNLDTNVSVTPYLAPIRAALSYERKWSNNFSSSFGMIFVSERFADYDKNVALPSFINVNLRAKYKISEDFSVFADLENLANQNIYIWNGYKERSVFASAGILWNF